MIGTDPPASTYGGEIDGLISFIWWIVFVFFLATEGLLIYFVLRYRRKAVKRAAWTPGRTLRASSWVLIPALVVLVLDLWIEARSADVWHEVIEDVPEHDVLIRVTGRQFAWTFRYAGEDGAFDTADDFETVNEIHVPIGKVIRVELESVDVLHSFWIPAMRYKQDVVPGRTIPGWFEATRVGRFEVACAELCGPSHTSMRAVLIVDTADAYQQWARLHLTQQTMADRAAAQ